MEALSCGTPMLAANAQGFALHLSHEKNARLFTPNDEESFDKELAIAVSTKLEGKWSREVLRESMACASVEKCTDVAIECYKHSSGEANYYIVRLFLSLFMMYL